LAWTATMRGENLRNPTTSVDSARRKVVRSMLFPAPAFLFVFLPITLLVVGMTVKLLGKTAGIVALIAASVVFYGNWRPSDLWIIGSSITINFTIANILSKPN